ncbi:legumin type B-like [Pistacia vera]|uniref:legumin type B-like n=1 Tax=Pistacia vera TaxID=55513 RepID=UPI00126373AC|nr:legumin type B-like [Pistacia vera]
MEMDLSAKFPKTIFEGEGGSYSSWSSSEFSLLAEVKVGGGLLVLKPGGFALPHYADSKKLGYVLQGEHGSVGLTLSNHEANSKEEIVLGLQAGDVIPVPLGAVSWWYNDGNSDVVILFLGETSTTYVPVQVLYVAKGSGKVQIVGMNGKRALDSNLPNVGELAGNISAECVRVHNSKICSECDSRVCKFFQGKMAESEILIPPMIKRLLDKIEYYLMTKASMFN